MTTIAQSLAAFADAAGGSAQLHARIEAANTAAEAFALAQADGVALGDAVAHAAREVAAGVVEGKSVAVEVIVFDRNGNLIGRAN